MINNLFDKLDEFKHEKKEMPSPHHLQKEKSDSVFSANMSNHKSSISASSRTKKKLNSSKGQNAYFAMT
jgi:hypothetical protein